MEPLIKVMVKVHVYSPNIPVNRFSRLYIVYPQVLELARELSFEVQNTFKKIYDFCEFVFFPAPAIL